jgi:glucose/arabinose dehydrogenase
MVFKRVLPGLVIALALSACGAVQSAALRSPAASPSTQPQTVGSRSTTSSAPAAASAAALNSATESIVAVSTVDPAHVTIVLEQVAAGFEQPLFLTHAGDGSNRTFVVEKGGQIRLLDGTLFLDVADRITTSGYEQGLLGLAFHPEFATNGLFFVYYTALDGTNTLSRFRATADGQRGDTDTELVLVQLASPHETHNGGMIAFGPDGMLYVGLGDGGGADDEFGNGQNGDTLLGKILRLDVNGGEPYAVPHDNPFVNDVQIRSETWAWGLRNPWRFSFDRMTGDLYIGDVEQNQWEEINFQPAASAGGENYGWSIREGAYCFYTMTCDGTGLTNPIVSYDRHQGIAVTGGYVYRGEAFPALQGAYVFGDYGTGRIWTVARDTDGLWTTRERTRLDGLLSSFGEDEQGELYVTDIGNGGVYRIMVPPR